LLELTSLRNPWAKENPEKKGQKTPEEVAAEVRAKGEK
jgi:hypothetical protein